jgi:hypothetical protein
LIKLFNKLILNIKKSFILTAIVFSAHSGALLLIFDLPIALGFRIGLAALIGVSFGWQGRYGLPARVCEMRLEEEGSCIRTANGEQRRHRIVRATAHAGFVRFTLQRAGWRTHVQIVPRDAVEPEIYRTLRARIVQRRQPVPEQDPA